jgi:hypothetical protein
MVSGFSLTISKKSFFRIVFFFQVLILRFLYHFIILNICLYFKIVDVFACFIFTKYALLVFISFIFKNFSRMNFSNFQSLAFAFIFFLPMIEAAPAVARSLMRHNELIHIFTASFQNLPKLAPSLTYMQYFAWYSALSDACTICEDDYSFKDIIDNDNGTVAEKGSLIIIMKLFICANSSFKILFSQPNLLNNPFEILERFKKHFENKKQHEMNEIFNSSVFDIFSDDINEFCSLVHQAGTHLDYSERQILDKLYSLLVPNEVFSSTLSFYLNDKESFEYETFVSSLFNNLRHQKAMAKRGAIHVNTSVKEKKCFKCGSSNHLANVCKDKFTKTLKPNGVNKISKDFSKLKVDACRFKRSDGKNCNGKHSVKNCFFNPKSESYKKCSNVNCSAFPHGHLISSCRRTGGAKYVEKA